MAPETEQLIKVFYREAYGKRLQIVLVFIALSAIGVLVGLAWPSKYSSSTTIRVEEQNIIEPLMQGAAVRADVRDTARNAREIMSGRSILLRVLQSNGQVDDTMPQAQVDGLIGELRANTMVQTVGQNLIRIEHHGSNADQVFATTSTLAEVFIDEMLANKAKESTAAFDFIDQQVKQYEAELKQTEQALKKLRTETPDARPGVQTEVAQRIGVLRTQIDDLEQQLRELDIREASIRDQLSGEAMASAGISRSAQYRTRVAELQTELDELRLSYKDTYPDIIALKQQIADLEQQADDAERRERELRAEAASEGRTYIDPSLRSNPVFQELQSQLYETNTEARTLRARLTDAREKLESELARSRQIQEIEAQLSSLTRDLEVNRSIYQDLLERRENARVSRNLDLEQQGLTLRITEQAYRPGSPSGPGLIHFAGAGLFLGLALPLGTLFGLLMIDPRVRRRTVLEDDLGLPLLEVVPHMHTPRENLWRRTSIVASILLFIATPVTVATIVVMRGKGML